MKRTREFWFFFFFCLTGSTSSFTFQFRLCPKAENRKVKLIDNVNAIVSIFNLLSLICLTFVTNAYFQSLQINFNRRFKRLKLRPTFPLRFFGGPSLHYVSLEANAKEGRNERKSEWGLFRSTSAFFNSRSASKWRFSKQVLAIKVFIFATFRRWHRKAIYKVDKINTFLDRFYRGGWVETSVTRLYYLLHFGQLFKPWGINYFAQIAHTRQLL